MRGLRFYTAVLAGLLAAGLLADDELKLDQYRIGQVSSQAPAQTDATQSVSSWKAQPATLDVVQAGERVYVTGPPGQYTLTQDITTISMDWESRKFTLAQSSYVTRITIGQVSLPPVVVPPGPGPGPIPVPTDRVTRVTYVFEKDATSVPRGVVTALIKLNAMGIIATEFEKDTIDGSGSVPAQYAVPLAAAKGIGLPALVVQSNLAVLRTLRNPQTEAEVLEAAK